MSRVIASDLIVRRGTGLIGIGFAQKDVYEYKKMRYCKFSIEKLHIGRILRLRFSNKL
jgi:hypothetical protein